jgi:Zn-dependent protease with chaperone function
MTTATVTAHPSAIDVGVADAFVGRIKRVRTSPLYLMALFVVAAGMVLLPLVYLGLVAGVGYGLYFHATENVSILESGRGYRVRLFGYAAPLVVGGVLFLFMVKPLFARQSRRERRLSLVRDNEPTLFAFVDRLCETVGAPKPRRIDVDCEINASASFRHGLWSMLGSDLVLTIGAPLAAGLSIRQFAGVLAHEFGHFAQGMGMRVCYVIRNVSWWFARVVYERDAWDEKVVELCQSGYVGVRIIFYISRFFVWITRWVLWLLMQIGNVISCGLLRQMEYDADRYEARISGSRSFEETVHQLHLLQMGSRAVHEDLWVSWKDRHLADNLPLLLTAKVAEISDKVQGDIAKAISESKTGLLSTHPSDSARIRNAFKENAEGVFQAMGPASQLFSNFDGLCKAATLFYYEDLTGTRLRPENLVSTASLAKRQGEMVERGAAAKRFFRGCLDPLRPLHISRFSDAADLPPKECLAKLKQARVALEKSSAVVANSSEGYAKLRDSLAQTRVAYKLLNLGLRIDPKLFNLTKASAAEARTRQTSLERAVDAKEKELAKVESVLRLRMECALALLNVKPVADRMPGAEQIRARSGELLEALSVVQSTADAVEEVRRNVGPLLAVDATFGEYCDDEDFVQQGLKLLEEQKQALIEVRGLLRSHVYPFEHADGEITMAAYAIGSIPAAQELSAMARAGLLVVESMDMLYLRLMGELAQIAERVEAAVGLKALAVPQETMAPATDPQARSPA